MLQKEFQVTPIYREITEWDEETGYHMGVYLCLNIKSHEFNPTDDIITNIDYFKKSNVNILTTIKQIWDCRDEKWEHNFMVIFLGESKHKIKKKAEQAACKMSIDKLS